MRTESTYEIEKRTAIPAPFLTNAAKTGALKAELTKKGERDVWDVPRVNLELFLLGDAAGVHRYKTEPTATASLVIDDSLNLRAGFCQATIDAYARDLAAGAALPPVIYLRDLGRAVIDGAHTLLGARKAGLHWVPAIGLIDILPQEARLIGIARNRAHGRSWTSADKNRILEEMLRDPVMSEWPLRVIAATVGVSHMTVARRLTSIKHPKRKLAERAEKTPVQIAGEQIQSAISILRQVRPELAAKLNEISRELAG